ncbi:hypothetical protein [Pontibacter chitinilyticus]|uniref:hypothetical protein n=1 Tax=Pontibacter chitinilyticus TaxID=2674989 RepID=UPI003219C377
MNMRYIAFLAILLIAGVAFAQPVKLKKVQLSKEVSAQLPQDFAPLTDDQIAQKYPAIFKPLAVYTSSNGRIDFSVTPKPSQFRPQDLNMLREFYKANLLEAFTKVDFIRDEVTQIKGKDFVVFEFVSTVADERQSSNLAPVQKYNIVQYTIQDKKLLIFTLQMPFSMKSEWQDTAHEVMNSVRVQ